MWILIAIVALVIILFLTSNGKQTSKKDSKPDLSIMPYAKKDRFLTEAEFNFYATLKSLLNNDNIIVCPKVGLKDFIYVTKGAGKGSIKYFNYIARKHVDFVVCDTKTMAIICAVELDDKSHNQKARQERDEFINKLYEKVGINLVHIAAKAAYTQEDIKPILDIINKGE